MNGYYTFRPDADRDVDEIHDYIALDSRRAAAGFVDAVYADAQKLAEMPGMGALRDFSDARLRGIRSWPIGGFENYLIFYFPTSYGIEVARIIHGARDVERVISP